MLRGDTEVPWRAVVATATLVAMFIGWLAAIWPAYHPFGTTAPATTCCSRR